LIKSFMGRRILNASWIIAKSPSFSTICTNWTYRLRLGSLIMPTMFDRWCCSIHCGNSFKTVEQSIKLYPNKELKPSYFTFLSDLLIGSRSTIQTTRPQMDDCRGETPWDRVFATIFIIIFYNWYIFRYRLWRWIRGWFRPFVTWFDPAFRS
jgi:hypothetical protein